MTLSDKRTEIQQKIGKIVRNTNISSSEKCSQIDEVIKEAVKKLKEYLNSIPKVRYNGQTLLSLDKFADMKDKLNEIFGEELI